tara:strand:+ start:19638 stop:19877 length:240 start_codon:yes stop_codon:yes gene_type:complete
MPSEARQLASFLALIVDEASGFAASMAIDLSLRCRSKGCAATILAQRQSSDEIVWRCMTCDESGVIRNWSGTKWDRSQH